MKSTFNVKLYDKDELLESFSITMSLKSMLIEARQLSQEKKTVIVKEYMDSVFIKKYIFYNGQRKNKSK